MVNGGYVILDFNNIIIPGSSSHAKEVNGITYEYIEKIVKGTKTIFCFNYVEGNDEGTEDDGISIPNFVPVVIDNPSGSAFRVWTKAEGDDRLIIITNENKLYWDVP